MGRGKNSGFIVEFTRPDGTVGTAIMRHSEQIPQFTSQGIAFLRLVDDQYRPVLGQDGKEKTTVKRLNELRRIGFVD